MIRIVTDTGSDVNHVEAKQLGVELMELEVRFDDFDYDFHNDLDFSVFYSNLQKAKNLPRTSQVNPSQYLDVFNDAKEKGDEMLVITLSSGLSGTHSSAQIAYGECGYDGITIIDSMQATIGQRMLVYQAAKLRDEGKTRAELTEIITGLSNRMGFGCCMDTMTYLKKGGRIPPAMALIGNALNIKPVISVVNGKAEAVDRVRGLKAGMRAVHNRLEREGFDENYTVYFGYTGDKERGRGFMEETAAKFGIKDYVMYGVGCVIGTHAGPGAIAVAYIKKS